MKYARFLKEILTGKEILSGSKIILDKNGMLWLLSLLGYLEVLIWIVNLSGKIAL